MSKLSNDHIKSLQRAINILQMHLNRQGVPKYQKEFRYDIKNLEQIKDVVEHECHTPQFSALDDTYCPLAW